MSVQIIFWLPALKEALLCSKAVTFHVAPAPPCIISALSQQQQQPPLPSAPVSFFSMGVEMQFRPAVHPLRRPLLSQSVRISATQSERLLDEERVTWQREFQALLQKYEPERAHQAPALLRVYAGMEYELLQCYRHHYTGTGGFRISATTASSSRDESASATASSQSRHASGVFSLPKAAIATYLREKRRARSRSTTNFNQNSVRSVNSSSCAKGNDIRSPEMPLLPTRAAPVPTNNHIQQQRQTHHPSSSISPSAA